jgi:large subunit ribosomal protein L18
MGASLSVGKHTATKAAARAKRQIRGRKKVFGSTDRPRLVVTRSAKHIGAQIVDDVRGVTLASASTVESELRALDGDKTARAKQVGAKLAERAKAAGVESVVFDRAGHKYHGRIAALADAARESGLGL